MSTSAPLPLDRLRAALTSLPGVLLVVVALTVLCRVETTQAPWAPYFLSYGAMALLIPLLVGVGPIWATKISGKALWKLTALTAVVAIGFDSGVFTLGYDALLAHWGLLQPFYSITSATDAMVELVTQRQQLSKIEALGIFAILALVWAPVVEELFYRGYVYNHLKRHLPKAAAWGIAVLAFGLRHTLHFFYLFPQLSVAGTVWCCSMLIFGSLMTWLYERTGGLGPPMLVHLLVNVAGLLAAPLP